MPLYFDSKSNLNTLNTILAALPLEIWQVVMLGTLVVGALLAGRRLARFNRPDWPLLSPTIALAAKWLLFRGAVVALVALLSLAIAMATMASTAHVGPALLAFIRVPLLSLVVGAALGVTIGLILVLRWIPRFERAGNLRDATIVLEAVRRQQRYDPRRFFDLGKGCFVGIDLRRKPVYLTWDKFRETHVGNVGTTGAGKSTLNTLMLFQASLQGESVIAFDPKGDRFASAILTGNLAALGKKVVLIDLRPEAPPQFNLLAGCREHEIEELLVAGFDLAARGTDGDFYRGKDQDAALMAAQLAVREGAASLPMLYQACAAIPEIAEQENFFRKLRSVSSITAVRTESGVDIASLINNGGVVYIIGSVDNERVKMLQKMLLVRVMQIIKSRSRNIPMPPVCVLLDELKHMLSHAALTGLAVVRDFGAHFLISHQSLGDLRQCPGIDPEAVFGAVIDNTAIKIVYRTSDSEYVDRLAKLGGTRRYFSDLVSRGKDTDSGDGSWREDRRYQIEPDLLLQLPLPSDGKFQPSVGVLFGLPKPEVICVSPIPVEFPPAVVVHAGMSIVDSSPSSDARGEI